MANPHTDPMKYLKPALIIGGSLLGWNYVIAPTLEALGIKPDASDKIMDKVENYDINRDYWSANYYSQIPSGNEAIILTSAKANELAAQIKKAKSIFNDDESAIYAAFRQLKYKTQVSFLVYWFNRLYKEDLYSWLKDEVLNDEEMRVVLTITEKLPLGIRNVSTGKITGVGADIEGYRWKPNATQRREYAERMREKEAMPIIPVRYAIRVGCFVKFYNVGKGEVISGTVVKESYGEKTGQHTFTIQSEDGTKTIVKGRNLYPNLLEHIPGEISKEVSR